MVLERLECVSSPLLGKELQNGVDHRSRISVTNRIVLAVCCANRTYRASFIFNHAGVSIHNSMNLPLFRTYLGTRPALSILAIILSQCPALVSPRAFNFDFASLISLFLCRQHTSEAAMEREGAQNQQSSWDDLQRYLAIFSKVVDDVSSLEQQQQPRRSILKNKLDKDRGELQALEENMQKTKARIAMNESSLHDLDVRLETHRQSASLETLQQIVRPELLSSSVCQSPPCDSPALQAQES